MIRTELLIGEFAVGLVVLLVIIHFLFLKTIFRGRSIRLMRQIRKSININSAGKKTSLLASHKKSGRGTLVVMISLVFFLEINLRLLGIGHLNWFKILHIAIALTSLVLLVMVAFPFSGEKKPRYHGTLAYTAYALFVIATVTGLPMFAWDLWQKIP